jgi:hypothetical protein
MRETSFEKHMIKYHTANLIKIAEVIPGPDLINSQDDIVEILGNAGYNNCGAIIIYERSLHPSFFDLKSGIAGEILQKVSNYRSRLAIVGDFSKIKSRSLKDFITESNSRGTICFVDSLGEAISRFDH